MRINGIALAMAFTIILLTGCANPGIVKVSQDTYVISRTDKAGIFGNASAMKADVLQEASDFAESQGMVALPVDVQEQPLVVGKRFASIDYKFRLVDKNGSSQGLNTIRNACSQEYQSNKSFDLIRSMIPEQASQATIAQRANSKKPTSAEKKSLEAFDTFSAQCRSDFLEELKKEDAPNGVIALYKKNMSAQTDLLADLWSGKITYGQYSTKRIELNNKYDEAVVAYLRELNKENVAQKEAQARMAIAQQEAQARADNANALQQMQSMYLINQMQQSVQPVQPIRQPVNTNCQRLGNSVNCTTY